MSDTQAFLARTTTLLPSGQRVSDLALSASDFEAARQMDEQAWSLWRAARSNDVSGFANTVATMERCAIEDGEWYDGVLCHQHAGCPGHAAEGVSDAH